MSDDEFSTQAAVEIVLDERSLRQAREQLNSELGQVQTGVTDGGTPSAQAGRAMSSRQVRRERRTFRLDRERNDLLTTTVNLLDEIEEQGLGGGGGGGGGGGLVPGGAAFGLGALTGGGGFLSGASLGGLGLAGAGGIGLGAGLLGTTALEKAGVFQDVQQFGSDFGENNELAGDAIETAAGATGITLAGSAVLDVSEFIAEGDTNFDKTSMAVDQLFNTGAETPTEQNARVFGGGATIETVQESDVSADVSESQQNMEGSVAGDLNIPSSVQTRADGEVATPQPDPSARDVLSQPVVRDILAGTTPGPSSQEFSTSTISDFRSSLRELSPANFRGLVERAEGVSLSDIQFDPATLAGPDNRGPDIERRGQQTPFFRGGGGQRVEQTTEVDQTTNIEANVTADISNVIDELERRIDDAKGEVRRELQRELDRLEREIRRDVSGN